MNKVGDQKTFIKSIYHLSKSCGVCVILYLLFCHKGLAQEQPIKQLQDGLDSLTLEMAIAFALENNHQIRVSRINTEIAENNVFPGNAGLLPQLFVEGSANPAIQDIDIEFAVPDQPPISQRDAYSISADAAVGVSYNLFDGRSKFHAFERLKEERGATRAQSGAEIENTLLTVINTYLEVARIEQEYNINLNMVELSQRRLERASVGYEFGTETRLGVLNAEVDLNADSVTLIRSLQNLENEKRNLNILLGRSPEEAIRVMTQVEINTAIDMDFILESAYERNQQLQQARYNQNIAELDIQTARAAFWPIIDLNASYGLMHQFNEAGFIRRQDMQGFMGGVTFRYNIFSGRQRSVQARNARLTRDMQAEQAAQIKKEIERDILNSYTNYRNTLFLLELERRNIKTAQANFERTQEEYNIGQATTTQFREAQVNLSSAELSIAEQLYQAKLAEVELYKIAGILIQETR